MFVRLRRGRSVWRRRCPPAAGRSPGPEIRRRIRPHPHAGLNATSPEIPSTVAGNAYGAAGPAIAAARPYESGPASTGAGPGDGQ